MAKKRDPIRSTLRVQTPDRLVAAMEGELTVKKVPHRKRIQALAELFDLFNRERGRIQGLRYLDVPKLRDAYLRYHVPLNVARVQCVLQQVRRAYPDLDAIENVVDLGAGPGTASLATAFTLSPKVKRQYVLYDRSRPALQIARRLLQACLKPPEDEGQEPTPESSVVTHVSHLPSIPSLPPRSLVLISMVLNEIGVGVPGGPDPDVILARLRRNLSPSSVVVLVEPALRLPGRNLMTFHDRALETGGWRVLAPCTHQRDCPLLDVRGKAWCHFRMTWEAPRFVREVADPLDLAWRHPSFSFLALARSEEPCKSSGKNARVIGDVMALRDGKPGVYLCQQGERRLYPLRGERVERGDIVEARQGARLVTRHPWSEGAPGS